MVDGVEREVPSPRVVLRGAQTLTLVRLPFLLFVCLPVSVVVPLGVAMLVGPGAPPPQLGPIGVSTWPGVFAVSVGVAVVGAIALEVWARGRRRTVEVFADRLVVGDVSLAQVVLLSDLDTFEDRSSDLVRLRPRVDRRGVFGWRDRLGLSVPAPPGEERAALIDTLLAAGLRRESGAGLPGRTSERALSPRVVASGAPPLVELALALVFLLVTVPGLHQRWRRSEDPFLRPQVTKLLTVVQVASLLGLVVSVSAFAPRRGRATFFDDRVRLRMRGSPEFDLGWGDVVGWRRVARRYVSLVVRAGRIRESVGEPTVPTLDPELRAQVEALLAARGVPRVG